MAGVPLSSVYYSVSGTAISYANDPGAYPSIGYAVGTPRTRPSVALLGHRNANEED